MPSFLCTKCGKNYDEGDAGRWYQRTGYRHCPDCRRSEGRMKSKVDDLEFKAEVNQYSTEIHSKCIEDLQYKSEELQHKVEEIPSLKREVAELRRELEKTVKVSDTKMAKIQKSVAAISPLQDKVKETDTNLAMLRADMEKKFREMDHKEKVLEKSVRKVELKVQEKKEMNKMLDKINNSKSPQVMLAFLQANSPRGNIVKNMCEGSDDDDDDDDDDEIITTFGTENAPLDDRDGKRWAKKVNK